jgi:hypothetical protein
MNLEITNKNDIAKSDFEAMKEIEGFQSFQKNQIEALAKSYKELLEKSETEELSKEDKLQLSLFKCEMSDLKAVNVINDDLTQEIVYYRSKEAIQKSQDIKSEIEKSLNIDKVRDAFEKGMIDEDTLEKATGHKYFKREGTPGNYKYYYTEAQYKKEKGEPQHEVKLDPMSPIKTYKEMSYSDLKGAINYFYSEAQKLKESGDKNYGVFLNAYENAKEVARDMKDPNRKIQKEETLKKIKELNELMAKRSKATKGSGAYKEYDKKIKELESKKVTGESGRTQGFKQSSSKEGGKSKEASMVLKEMDKQEEPNYTAALNKVLKETGANKGKLEKELEKYI